MDWNRFATPTKEKILSFRKELFSDIFYATWREYEKSGDSKIMAAVLLQVMSDFPDLKDVFDLFYDQYTDDDALWSDKKVVFRFFQKLLIVYEGFEFDKQKV